VITDLTPGCVACVEPGLRGDDGELTIHAGEAFEVGEIEGYLIPDFQPREELRRRGCTQFKQLLGASADDFAGAGRVEAELGAFGAFGDPLTIHGVAEDEVLPATTVLGAKVFKVDPQALAISGNFEDGNLLIADYLESSGRPRLRLICADISTEVVQSCRAVSAANSPVANHCFTGSFCGGTGFAVAASILIGVSRHGVTMGTAFMAG